MQTIDGVAGQLAEVDAVDVPAEARDAALDVARDDDVVDGERRRARPRARPGRSRARRRGARPASARRTAVSSSPGSAVVRKPTRPKLTPKTGTPRAGHLLQRAQHGAVAAEHDHEVGLRDVGVGRQQLDARLGREARDDARRRRRRCGAPAAPRGAR